MTHSKTKRKGARWLDLGQERWSYYVGKKFVEVTSPEGKKTLIPREKLDQFVQDPYGDEGEGADITLPGAVARYVKASLRT